MEFKYNNKPNQNNQPTILAIKWIFYKKDIYATFMKGVLLQTIKFPL